VAGLPRPEPAGPPLARGRRRGDEAGCYVSEALEDDAQRETACVEVDPELQPVEISCLILHEIERHARETYPEECCGLLSGDETVRFRRLHRCRNEMTALHDAAPASYPCDGRSAFHMNPLEYARIEEDVYAQGGRITAVYHSHVGARAYFSSVDLEFASRPDFPFPEADHIVVALVAIAPGGDGSVLRDQRALFRRGGEQGRFRGHPLKELPA
jgi:proteasome lid subunit RPN8/RPN11